MFTCACQCVWEPEVNLDLGPSSARHLLRMLLYFNLVCVHVFMSGDMSVQGNTGESHFFSYSMGCGTELGLGGKCLFPFSLTPPCVLRQSFKGTWGLPWSQGNVRVCPARVSGTCLPACLLCSAGAGTEPGSSCLHSKHYTH